MPTVGRSTSTDSGCAEVEVSGVSFAYGVRTALTDISFAVPAGSLFGLLGPNGSGKSTLFRLLATLLPVQTGRLSICGHDVATQQSLARRRTGVTFQSPALDPRLTVQENLWCHGRIYGLSASQIRNRSAALLGDLGVAGRSHELVSTLSGGLKRRVELAKGLLHEPDVLLLDEPTVGLDPAARNEFWDLISERRRTCGTTIVVTTHLMPEAEMCDIVMLMNNGRVAAVGKPADLQQTISGDRLVVRIREPDRWCKKLEELLGQPVQCERNQLMVRVPDPVACVSQVLNDRELPFESVEVRRTCLEDVYFHLTGRSWDVTGSPG